MPFFIVECKNWSKPSERKDLDAFAGKLIRRGARCRLAFFVAVNGFSKGFLQVAHEYTAQGPLVVTLDGDALEAPVLAGSRTQRNELLKGYNQRAALRAHMA